MRLMKIARSEGLEVFLYVGKLNARRNDRKLTDTDKLFLKKNKVELISEIRDLSSGTRISGEDFFGPGLMQDAIDRMRRNDK